MAAHQSCSQRPERSRGKTTNEGANPGLRWGPWLQPQQGEVGTLWTLSPPADF